MTTTYRVALGGPNSTVHIASFDAAAPRLTADPALALAAERATWLLAHPTAAGIYFATGELDGGVVRVLRIPSSASNNDDAKPEVLASVPSGGQHPTHLALSPSSNELLVANYSAGGVGVLRVLPSAPYLAPELVQRVEFLYTPPAPHEPGAIVPDRQEKAHPHQVLVVKDDVLVPDLGSDRVWRLAKSVGAGGEGEGWEVVGALEFPRGSGPRHALVHDGVLYTVCELSNQLAAHTWPSQEHLGTLSTLGSSSPSTAPAPAPLLPTEIVYADPNSAPPADPPREQKEQGEDQDPQLAAEILVDGDGFIYVTNRNEPDSKGDSIAVFSPHPDFKLVRRIHTGVKHLRGIAFSPDGRYAALAGVDRGGVKIFERVPGGKGELRDVGAALDLKEVGSVLWL